MRSTIPHPGAARASATTTTARLAAPMSARPLNLRTGRVSAPLPGTAGGSRGNTASSGARPGGARSSAPGRRALHVAAVFERFTERAIKGVMLAQQEAKSLGAAEVGTEHVLLGLIAEEPPSKDGYMGCGITLEAARSGVSTMTGRGRKAQTSSNELPFSELAKKIFEVAVIDSKRMGMNYITPEQLLASLLSSASPAGGGGSGARRLLDALGVAPDALRAAALAKLKGDAEAEGERRGGGRQGGNGGGSSDATRAEGAKVLAELTRDLTAEAAEGGPDPVIGRSKEVARCVQILARRSKNNPILLGEPGVGKTAIAEGLATAIVSGTLPDGDPLPAFLAHKRILSLDLGLVLAGAKERGELESRITKMLAEIQAAGDVILVIDEIHVLVGAGSIGGRGGGGGGGGMDIANLLKPPLARGLLQCIGATTLDEHRKHIERDPALERRFQPVVVGEPTEAEALEILEGLAPRYEAHHRCVYAPGALAAAVALSARYVADRYLPDKAIDLMDEAGSRARIDAYLSRKAGGAVGSDANGAEPWAELEASMAATADAARAGLFEEAGVLADRERDVRARLVGQAGDAPGVPAVTRRDIEAIVAQWTRVPVEAMSPDESERLLGLGATLGERVIGQDAAVAAVARAMQRSRSGLKDEDRPIAGMLFAGPTGVGKTELTRALCEHVFGARDAMVRLDMSEFMERHTVAKLIGAPPGYVGYGEGGKLTEAVRRRPYTVVLFDEIEKAHPDVFNILLQVLEDGRLTDSGGRVVSFKNTLIIMTSNVGSAVISGGGATRSIGFDLDEAEAGSEAAEASAYGKVRSLVLGKLKGFFRPELLNRLDEVVVFRQLAQEDVRRIADLELASTAARMAGRGLHLEVTAALMDRIVAEGYDREYGARPLRRSIIRLVDDTLSDALLHDRLTEGDVAVMDVDASTGEPTVTAVKPYGGSGGGPPSSPSTGSATSDSPALTGDVRSQIVYSSLSKRRAEKEAAERKAEDVRA